MIIEDKNRTLVPPAGYELRSVEAEGAYLRLHYRRILFRAGTTIVQGEKWVHIFLNDQGREVVRTVQYYESIAPVPAEPPKTIWEVVRDGFQGFWRAS